MEYEEVTFLTDFKAHPKSHVVADRTQLYKVFSNLIANSVKFIQHKEKVIKISASVSSEGFARYSKVFNRIPSNGRL